MKDNQLLILPLTDYFKMFLEKNKISIHDDIYTELMETIISIGISKIYDITGAKYNDDIKHLSKVFQKTRLPIIMNTDFMNDLDIVTNELITYLIVYGAVDKTIYLVDSTYNYNTFNAYRV